MINRTLILSCLFLAMAAPPFAAGQTSKMKFCFAPATAHDDFTLVPPDATYSKSVGYGFERGYRPDNDKPFYFSVALPEGNYNVLLTLGGGTSESTTTVKAELRRLMLENVHAAPGELVKRTITINIRTPAISNGDKVSLKGAREAVTEAWAWDEKMTLEFNGVHPSVREIQITKADGPTVFLLGDSTVCDQSGEPWNSWGQMLTRFLKPWVAVSNHAESGETCRSSLHARRLEKVLDSMKPGDYLFVQYGHNDQKEKGPNDGPFTSYKSELKQFVDGARSKGGIPVLVTSVSRKSIGSLGDFPAAVRQLAAEEKVALIDLNKMSETLYAGIGKANLGKAFVDGTHHNAYGSYEVAKCIVDGIQENELDLAKFIVDDFKPFDPAHPDPIADFKVPASPTLSSSKPLGN